MNHYEIKQDDKRERLEAAAARTRAASESAFKSAHDRIAGIPPGQPILIGHHSEKRHRSALRKHDAAMRRGFELQEKAQRLEARAANIATGAGGISSDDPEAVAKLTDKRTDLERERDTMKAANVAYKKGNNESLLALTGKTREQWDAEIVRFHHFPRQPFPGYALTNIGARIRDAQKRAARIETVQATPYSREVINGCTLTIDPDDNRVTIAFPVRISREDHKRVRSWGFLWSPTRKGYTRKLSTAAIEYARTMAREHGTPASPAPVASQPQEGAPCYACNGQGSDDGATSGEPFTCNACHGTGRTLTLAEIESADPMDDFGYVGHRSHY